MKVKFYLKEPKKKQSLVYLILNYRSRTPFKYSTGIVIPVKAWNSTKQRLRRVAGFPEYSQYNLKLEKLSSQTITVFQRLQNQNITITNNLLRTELNVIRGKVKKKEKYTFESFFNKRFKIDRKDDNNLKDYVKHYKLYKKFAGNKVIEFDDITLDFYFDYVEWMYSKNYATSYVASSIKHLKAILEDARAKDYNQNLAYKSKLFKKPTYDVTHVYLDTDKIQKLFDFKFESERLEKVRDFFVLDCCMGLRFSNMIEVTKDNLVTLKGVDFISIKAKKSDKQVLIPISRISRVILEKYDYNVPQISNQKLNDYVKEVCEVVGLDEEVIIKKHIGGKAVEETGKFFEYVSTHTARRSFCTNAYKAGVPAIAIMAITGHKTEREFLNYIKISEVEQALITNQHSFFN